MSIFSKKIKLLENQVTTLEKEKEALIASNNKALEENNEQSKEILKLHEKAKLFCRENAALREDITILKSTIAKAKLQSVVNKKPKNWILFKKDIADMLSKTQTNCFRIISDGITIEGVRVEPPHNEQISLHKNDIVEIDDGIVYCNGKDLGAKTGADAHEKHCNFELLSLRGTGNVAECFQLIEPQEKSKQKNSVERD